MSFADILTAAIPALVTAGAGILGQGAADDRQEKADQAALQAQQAKTYLELRLQALKAAYAGGSGGGGGGGGAAGPDPNKLTLAERIAALQNQGDSKQSSINNLITAMQNGYSLSARG